MGTIFGKKKGKTPNPGEKRFDDFYEDDVGGPLIQWVPRGKAG